VSLADFTRAYITCALWSSNDESRDDGGDPIDDNYGPEDLAPETRAKLEADCKAFFEAQRSTWSGQWARVSEHSEDEQAGHDFWLTRNGHGAGFWDGDWSEPAATTLTDACKAFHEYHLYVGDDGLIWGA
jgi:hypothetical protein